VKSHEAQVHVRKKPTRFFTTHNSPKLPDASSSAVPKGTLVIVWEGLYKCSKPTLAPVGVKRLVGSQNMSIANRPSETRVWFACGFSHRCTILNTA